MTDAPVNRQAMCACPYCGEQILRAAQKCRHCGEFLRNTRSTTSRAPVIAGWICLVIGLALMYFSLLTIVVYGPLFVAAFILSIIGMARRRVVGGLILLLLTAFLPIAVFAGLGSMRMTEVAKKVSAAREERKVAAAESLAGCDIEETEVRNEDGYMYLQGKVRNNGDRPVEFIKIRVEWLDADGVVLDSDWTYAIGGEGLRSGSAKGFEVMTPYDDRMEKYRCWLSK